MKFKLAVPKGVIQSLLGSLALCIGLSGCAYNSVFINYPSQMAQVKQNLASDNPMKELKQLESAIQGNDGLLYAQEAGRVAQIAGDFSQSQKFFNTAIADYKHFDDKATVSASDIGSTASSIFLNDNVIPYRGPGFERIMVHQYQAFNYLFQGDFQGALVEVRRSNELQSLEQARYEKSQSSVRSMANGTIDSEVRRLEDSTSTVTSSFLNAYSYYVTGMLHEVLGEHNDAFIDYRKAAQITPDNTYLQQDLVRLAKQLSMPQYQEFKQQWGEAPKQTHGQGQVIFLIERGFVPEKQSLTVPFTIDGNIQTASLATYWPSPSMIEPAQIYGLGQRLTAAPIAEMDALAVTALKEELPAALVRQAARVYAKSEMASSIGSKSKKRSNQADIGLIAMQIFNVVSEQADRRSWLTLPRQAQIARQYLDAGQYNINMDSSQAASISIEAGRTTLVWAIETGHYTRFYSILI